MAETELRRVPLVETTGLGKRYGSVAAVQDLNISVRRGEVYGFLGPNGAGKTTTILLLLGLLRASRGGARIVGRDVWSQRREVPPLVGYLPGELVA